MKLGIERIVTRAKHKHSNRIMFWPINTKFTQNGEGEWIPKDKRKRPIQSMSISIFGKVFGFMPCKSTKEILKINRI